MSKQRFKIDFEGPEGFVVVMQSTKALLEGHVLDALIRRQMPWFKRIKFAIGSRWLLRAAVKEQLKNLDEGRATLMTRVPRPGKGIVPPGVPIPYASNPDAN